MFIKKLLLSVVLGLGLFGVCGTALAANHATQTNTDDDHSPSSDVRKAHSPHVRSANGYQTIEWKVDLTIHDAEGVECRVEVELCNAAGKPFLGRDGKPVRLTKFVMPDSDEFKPSNVIFRMSLNYFWELYGRDAHDLTFKVVVKAQESGKVLNAPAVIGVTGLSTVLPTAPTERTDNPTFRPKSVWLRLVMG